MDETDFKRARHEYKYRNSMSPEQITSMFNDFAATYNDHDCRTHISMAMYLTEFYKPEVRSEVKVLDVAAGTGALGRELKKSGFLHVDGLDPADKMLKVARSMNIYNRYFVEYMDGNRIKDISTDSYDLVTVSAGFNVGLIPLKGFKEMIRIVKPGGFIIFASPDRMLEEAYKGEFSPFLSTLVKQGVLEETEVISLEDGMVSYPGSGPGKLYNYRVKETKLPDSFWEVCCIKKNYL